MVCTSFICYKRKLINLVLLSLRYLSNQSRAVNFMALSLEGSECLSHFSSMFWPMSAHLMAALGGTLHHYVRISSISSLLSPGGMG